MIARWLNGRLLSIGWFFHATHGWRPALCYCVHRLQLREQCWQCDDKVIPDNYKVVDQSFTWIWDSEIQHREA